MSREDIAQFTIESVQVLSEDEAADESLVPELTNDELLEFTNRCNVLAARHRRHR